MLVEGGGRGLFIATTLVMVALLLFLLLVVNALFCLSLSNTGEQRYRRGRGRGRCRCRCCCDGLLGGKGRGSIVFGDYDGSTILVLPESFFSSSSIDIFSRSHNQNTYPAAVIGTDDGAEVKHSISLGRPNRRRTPEQSTASTREGRTKDGAEAKHSINSGRPKRSIASTSGRRNR